MQLSQFNALRDVFLNQVAVGQCSALTKMLYLLKTIVKKCYIAVVHTKFPQFYHDNTNFSDCMVTNSLVIFVVVVEKTLQCT